MYAHISRIYLCLGLVAIFVVGSSTGKIMRIRQLDHGDRITNGQNTTIDIIPSIVQIWEKNATNTDGFICGGTLISERHVVSAAHCFVDYEAGDIAIVANATYLEGDNVGAIRRYAAAIYKHRKYDNVTDDNDIVVIKLSEPLTFGKGVQKAQMCEKNWRGNVKVTVAGWGDTVDGGDCPSNQLQMVKLNTIRRSACRQIYDGISKKMTCCIVRKGRDACNGDSGGPAFYKGKLCGVVSFGFGCGINGEPSVFASIPGLRKFINKSMEK